MKIAFGSIIERVLEDDHVHEQVATAGSRLRAAYRRTRVLRTQEAAQDKQLYEHVRAAAGALTEAGRRRATVSRGCRLTLLGSMPA